MDVKFSLERWLWAIESRVLKGIFGPKSDGVKGGLETA
jgi:hypothetical protein